MQEEVVELKSALEEVAAELQSADANAQQLQEANGKLQTTVKQVRKDRSAFRNDADYCAC